MEILGRKITTEKTLEKRNVSCKTQAAKTPAMIVPNTKFSKKRKAKKTSEKIYIKLRQNLKDIPKTSVNACPKMLESIAIVFHVQHYS